MCSAPATARSSSPSRRGRPRWRRRCSHTVARLTRARLRRLFRRESIGVDVAAAFDLVGSVLLYLSPTYLFPTVVALFYGESPWPFLIAGVLTAAVGGFLQVVATGREFASPREGFLVVALT